MKKKDLFKTEDFILETFEREVTIEQLRHLGNMVDNDTLQTLKDNRQCQCIRVQHKTGVWTAEYPIYCKVFFIINAFNENDTTDMVILNNLLNAYMEDSTIIGDEQYYKEIRQAKENYAQRMAEKEKEEP